MGFYKRLFLLYLLASLLTGLALLAFPILLGLNQQTLDPAPLGDPTRPTSPLTGLNISLGALAIIMLTLIPGFLFASVTLAVGQTLLPPRAILLRQMLVISDAGFYALVCIRAMFLLYLTIYPEQEELRQEAVRLQGMAYQVLFLNVGLNQYILMAGGLHYKTLPRWVCWGIIGITSAALLLFLWVLDPTVPHIIRANVIFMLHGFAGLVLFFFLYWREGQTAALASTASKASKLP